MCQLSFILPSPAALCLNYQTHLFIFCCCLSCCCCCCCHPCNSHTCLPASTCAIWPFTDSHGRICIDPCLFLLLIMLFMEWSLVSQSGCQNIKYLHLSIMFTMVWLTEIKRMLTVIYISYTHHVHTMRERYNQAKLTVVILILFMRLHRFIAETEKSLKGAD